MFNVSKLLNPGQFNESVYINVLSKSNTCLFIVIIIVLTAHQYKDFHLKINRDSLTI